ncbi:MAG: TonB-dependent receptor [Bacteroidota bacterium]
MSATKLSHPPKTWQVLLLFAWLLFSLIELSAHGHSIQGQILEADTQYPLAGVKVSIPELQKGTYTNELGSFRLDDLPAGEHQLHVSIMGFEERITQVALENDQALDLQVALLPKPLELAEVKITTDEDMQAASRRVSGLDLTLRPVQSAQDVLRVVPGLFVAQHAGGGKAEQLFLRGFDIDHGTDLRINVDGMPVNQVSHAHGQGYSDLHFVIPEMIASVDFEKGPYDAATGNFATAGQVNLQTRTALEQSMIGIEAGQFDQYRLVGAFDLLPNQSRHHAYIAGESLFSEGYFDAPQNFTRQNLMGKYSGLLDDQTLLSVSLMSFRSSWDASGQIPLRAVESGQIGHFGAIDDTEGGQTERHSLNLELNKQLEHGYLRQQFYAVRSSFELFSNFTFFLEDQENGDQIRQREQRSLLGYQGSYGRTDEWLGLQVKTEAGLEWRMDEVRDNELSQTTNRTELRQYLALGEVNEQQLGGYVMQSVRFSPRWQAEWGLRYDQFRFGYEDALSEVYDPQSVSQGILSPKLRLRYQASENLQFYAYAGSGYHSNDSRVILTQQSREILPSATGADVGVWWKPSKRVLLQVAAWGLDSEQEFVYVGDGGAVEPGDPSRRLGVDLSLRSQLTNWLWADADVTYSHGRTLGVEAEEAFIPLAPVWTATGGLFAQLGSKWTANLRARYLGDRPADESYSLTAEGYLILDGNLRYTTDRFQIGLEAQNLLNQQWKETQFATTSQLKGESDAITEIHYTPGTPFNARLVLRYFF